MVLCPGAPKGSTGSGSVFKASQKTGGGGGFGLMSHPTEKSHPKDLVKPGIEPATPGLQDKVYPLHHGSFLKLLVAFLGF